MKDQNSDKIREMYDAKKEVPNPAANSQGAHLAAMVNGTTVSPTLELRDNESQRWAAEQTLKLGSAYPKETQPGTTVGPLAVQVVFESHDHAAQSAVGVRVVFDRGGETP